MRQRRSSTTNGSSPIKQAQTSPHDHQAIDGNIEEEEKTNSSLSSPTLAGYSQSFPILPSSASSSSSSSSLQGGVSATSSANGQGVVSTRRWRDWWLRLGMTGVMIASCFAYVFICKQPGVVLLIFILQSMIYRELVQLAAKESRENALPGFRAFYYYWFFVFALYVYLRTFKRYLLSELRGVPVVDVSLLDGSGDGSTSSASFPPSLSNSLWSSSSSSSSMSFFNIFKFLTTSVDGGNNNKSFPASFIQTLDWVVSQHEPICYILYILGFIAFVISLQKRKNFRYQFGQFAFCHIALLFVVAQSTYLAANVYNGIIWFFVPCGLVVCNDSMAYVSGFFFGKTPLIRLSPKKTVEGFIGGALSTLIFAFISTSLYTSLEIFNIKYLMCCPVESGVGWGVQKCDVDAQAGGLYKLFPISHFVIGKLLVPSLLHDVVWCSEMQLHAIAFAVFASLVAPFGGFFASGFKRAFKIKDFGDAIPGHGGFTDRMDCQLIMGSFSYIYCVYNMHLGPGSGSMLVRTYMQMLVDRLSSDDLSELHNQLTAHMSALQK
jgi:CDP-diglyceride synthetase